MKLHAAMLAATLFLGLGPAASAMPAHVPSAEPQVIPARVVCDWRGCYERRPARAYRSQPMRRYGPPAYEGRRGYLPQARGWQQPGPEMRPQTDRPQPGDTRYMPGVGRNLVPPSTNANGGNQN